MAFLAHAVSGTDPSGQPNVLAVAMSAEYLPPGAATSHTMALPAQLEPPQTAQTQTTPLPCLVPPFQQALARTRGLIFQHLASPCQKPGNTNPAII